MKFIDTAYAAPKEHAEAATGYEETTTNATTADAHASTQVNSDAGVLGSLGINGQLFVSQLINFAIVAAILWFLILKPLTKKMTERQGIIDESLDNAKRIQENLTKSEAEYQARMAEAKAEANKLLERTMTEAGEMGDAMKVKAKQEIEVLIEQAKKNIRIEKDEMVAGLKKDTADLIVTALEKILNEKMDGKKDREMIIDMIAKIK